MMDVKNLSETQCRQNRAYGNWFRAQLTKFNLPSVTVAGVDVPVQTNSVRNLRVMFDSGMTMSAHVASIIRSANYHLTNISRACKMLTAKAAKLAVHTLVTSRLDYCNSLLIGINKSLITRLQNVQRTSARIIVKRRKHDSVTPELIALDWLPIQQLIKFKVLLLVYKAPHKQSPSYISDLFQLQPTRRQLRSSSSSSHFIVPRTHRVSFADRSLSCFGPKEWNTLPNHIKGCGMGPWLVLVSPCLNVVAKCKIGSFLYSLDNLLQKNVIVFFFGNQISKWRSFGKRAIFDLLFTFFSHQGKVTKFPSAHISLTYIYVLCSPYCVILPYQF